MWQSPLRHSWCQGFGGLKAIFDLESSISLEPCAQDNRTPLFYQASIVGLINKYGTVAPGRQTTPLYDTAIQFDPMGFAPRHSLYKRASHPAAHRY
ncbi:MULTISPECIES: hypothetical protein [Cupriavidus]|uniref:hypothetical protein n=1 Tax=Cupriavidus TaxID=106589 RepID=UPI000463DBE2|nr:hypothetical protein [Cupriavidus sp. SHE]KWR81732.1 hypothetical protein RN01_15750 [Cupriavidus sp. SHE]